MTRKQHKISKGFLFSIRAISVFHIGRVQQIHSENYVRHTSRRKPIAYSQCAMGSYCEYPGKLWHNVLKLYNAWHTCKPNHDTTHIFNNREYNSKYLVCERYYSVVINLYCSIWWYIENWNIPWTVMWYAWCKSVGARHTYINIYSKQYDANSYAVVELNKKSKVI